MICNQMPIDLLDLTKPLPALHKRVLCPSYSTDIHCWAKASALKGKMFKEVLQIGQDKTSYLASLRNNHKQYSGLVCI